MTLDEMRLRVAAIAPDGHVVEFDQGGGEVLFSIGKRGLAEVVWKGGAWWTWVLNRKEDSDRLALSIENVTAHQLMGARARQHRSAAL